jgi:putative MATE family efflux protein
MTVQPLPNTLGSENIGKLLRQYSLPSIVAMTAASLYNIIDSVFIGHSMGALAISGLAITFPLMNLSAAFGTLVGVGASTLISIRLGQRDYQGAQKILGNVVGLNLIIGICYTILSLLFLDPMLYFFGASDATIGYAREYMQVILLGNVITHIYFGLNSVLRASGQPVRSMYATIATVILNTLLVPIFIFVLGWGIRGAALGTVLSQLAVLIWQIVIFSNKNSLLHFHKSIFRLKKRIVVDSLAIGLAPFLMNLAACVVVILINQGLTHYGGDLSVGAYGIVNRVAFVFLMVVMGLNQGMQPIVGYNYGARQPERVRETLKLAIKYAVMITSVGFLAAEIFPHQIALAFTTDEELISRAVSGMRIVMLVFPLVGAQMVTSNFFQSIGMVKPAIFLSLTRQVILLIPLLLILPFFMNVTGVWISLPIADFVSAIIAAVMLRRQLKRLDTP